MSGGSKNKRALGRGSSAVPMMTLSSVVNSPTGNWTQKHLTSGMGSREQLTSKEEEEEPGLDVGFYFITKGYAAVRNHDDGFMAKKLMQGDYFGESDPLKVVGYTFGMVLCIWWDLFTCIFLIITTHYPSCDTRHH